MKRAAARGNLILRSTWLRLLALFVVFGVVFAVYTHKKADSVADRATSRPEEDKVKVQSNAKVEEEEEEEMKSIFDFSVDDIDGQTVRLSKYRNRVTLILNGATVWGVTKKNYLQLQELYKRYEPLGLSVLVFPCNQFGSQVRVCLLL